MFEPTPTGYIAMYEITMIEGKWDPTLYRTEPFSEYLPVAAFDAEGRALVCSHAGRLTPVAKYNGIGLDGFKVKFCGVRQAIRVDYPDDGESE